MKRQGDSWFSRKFPFLLLGAYLLLFAVCAVRPFDRSVWFAENVPIALIVLALVPTYRTFRFSNASYALMSVLLFLHTIGGHYSFERVPFGFVTELFNFSRNHYDRVAHFSVGFFAYPLAELLIRTKAASKRWVVLLFPVTFILAVAAGYEVFEWWYAMLSDPLAGNAVLGSQGDVWDAQKDMLADGLGAFAATLCFWWWRRKDVNALSAKAKKNAQE